MKQKVHKWKRVVGIFLVCILCSSMLFAGAQKEIDQAEQGPVLKIGVLGVMSGAGASWGLVMKYATEAIAEMYNREGGIEIDGTKYRIEIVSVDTRMDARVAKTGMEKLVYQDKIKYIIGTNIDDTTASSQPVLEAGGAVNVTYAFAKELFQPPHFNTFLGMPTPYTSAPIIYGHTMDKYGVKTISFVARNDADALYERDEGVQAAKDLGLTILSQTDTYEPNTTDFYPVMTKVVSRKPDQIVLSGVSPGDSPLLIKAARELGYKGVMSTETSGDTKIMQEIAGDYGEGFLCVGSANLPDLSSDFMKEYIGIYSDIAGEWNDEAGTKCYALYMVLQTLKVAGKEAIDDVEIFKEAVPKVQIKNPFLEKEATLAYVGEKTLGQPRQIGVPLVINQFIDGAFTSVLIKTDY